MQSVEFTEHFATLVAQRTSVRPSTICMQEIEFAASLNKRLAPIICRPVHAKSGSSCPLASTTSSKRANRPQCIIDLTIGVEEPEVLVVTLETPQSSPAEWNRPLDCEFQRKCSPRKEDFDETQRDHHRRSFGRCGDIFRGRCGDADKQFGWCSLH